MADILDKAILIGLGLEKKAKEVLDELEKAGKASSAEGAKEGEALPPKQALENRVVDDAVKAMREFVNLVKEARDKVASEVSSSSAHLLERLHVPTRDEVEVIKEMARVAREKVDDLERKVRDLEARLSERR